MNVGCVGSRQLTPEQLAVCEAIGFYLATHGHTVVTGGAPGADQAFANGAARALQGGAAGGLLIFLPWPGFEREHIPSCAKVVDHGYPAELVDLAARCQKGWASMKHSWQLLKTRNAAIAKCSTRIIAWPRRDPFDCWTGGTAHTLACAKELGLTVTDLSDPVVLTRVQQQL